MFDTINGIPLHPLVVHGVVVLMPLAVLGTVAIVLRPAWRGTYGHLVLGLSVVATALVPVATTSGKQLEERVGDPGKHQELGEQLLWISSAFLAVLVVFYLLDRRARTSTDADGSARSGSRVLTAVGALALVAALVTGAQVYRVGDSGARQAWCGVADCTPVQ